jgi:RHS repeat-associated protein
MVNRTVGFTTTQYAYGSYNRLTSAGSTTLTYDANGDEATKLNGTTSWAYSYDYEDRLTGATKNTILAASYLYDGSGDMVQSAKKDAVDYGYEGTNRVYASNVNTASAQDYFYANGLLVATLNDTTISYYQEDALGSVRLASGGQTYSSNYRPFGGSSQSTGSSSIRFAGKPSDLATGLYYFGARCYDPTIERFITEDSKSGSREDSQSLNRYVYARDNPLAILDPTGHYWWSGLADALSNDMGGGSGSDNRKQTYLNERTTDNQSLR